MANDKPWKAKSKHVHTPIKGKKKPRWRLFCLPFDHFDFIADDFLFIPIQIESSLKSWSWFRFHSWYFLSCLINKLSKIQHNIDYAQCTTAKTKFKMQYTLVVSLLHTWLYHKIWISKNDKIREIMEKCDFIKLHFKYHIAHVLINHWDEPSVCVWIQLVAIEYMERILRHYASIRTYRSKLYLILFVNKLQTAENQSHRKY